MLIVWKKKESLKHTSWLAGEKREAVWSLITIGGSWSQSTWQPWCSCVVLKLANIIVSNKHIMHSTDRSLTLFTRDICVELAISYRIQLCGWVFFLELLPVQNSLYKTVKSRVFLESKGRCSIIFNVSYYTLYVIVHYKIISYVTWRLMMYLDWFWCYQETSDKILPYFDVRPASVRQELSIVEHRQPGPLTHYLNSFKHALIINGNDIENIKDLEGNEDFDGMEEYSSIRIFSLFLIDVGLEISIW